MNNLQLVLLILLLSYNSTNAQSITRYDGKIKVDVLEGLVNAQFEITVDVEDADSIKLFIHESSQITSISSSKQIVPYTIGSEKFLEEGKAILIASSYISDDNLSIAYSNNLKNIKNPNFKFRDNWLELNLYTSWFPLNVNYGLFKYNLQVYTPSRLVSSGVVTKEDGIWNIDQDLASFDIPIVISDDLGLLSTDNIISIYYMNLDDDVKRALKSTSEEYFDIYNQLYGQTSTENLSIVASTFKRTNAYARKGFISMSLDSILSERNKSTLAHEIGHLWWNKANVSTWEDWLNEAFAEYSSLIVYRRYHSEEKFRNVVERLAERVANLPAIMGIDKSDPRSNIVLTHKGAYLLNQLENKIGRDSFTELLREAHHVKVIHTKNFVDLIKNKFGDEVAIWFEMELKR